MPLPIGPRSCPHPQVRTFLAIRTLSPIRATALRDNNLQKPPGAVPRALALPISFPPSTLTISTPKSLATKQIWTAFLFLGAAQQEDWNRLRGRTWETKEEGQRP